MNMTDPIGDMLSRIRNGVRARAPKVDVPASRLKTEIARILKQEGYIADYEVTTGGAFPELRVTNKFVNRAPAITGLKRVSKPGLRRYVGSQEIPRVLGGLGISILSTPRGIVTGREAKKQNVGGELLAYVW